MSARAEKPTHLVILCCHAVYHGDRGSDPRLESNWALKPFQKGNATKSGEHTTFLQHAFAAIQLIDPDTVVAFSGGPTDAAYPHLSEARSYRNAVEDWAKCIGYSLPVTVEREGDGSMGPLLLEEDATDSYQNVLFSVLKFRRVFGRYPRDLTIITHAFKNERFLELHAKALRWPRDHVKVVGINPPFSKAELDSTIAGEKKNGYGPWSADLYGTQAILSEKRRVRGWADAKSVELGEDLESVVQRLLQFQGGAEVFPDTLPWEQAAAQ